MLFKTFIYHLDTVKDDFIGYPSSEEELQRITNRYNQNYRPGCGGSVDVVHVIWSNCPVGGVNRPPEKRVILP